MFRFPIQNRDKLPLMRSSQATSFAFSIFRLGALNRRIRRGRVRTEPTRHPTDDVSLGFEDDVRTGRASGWRHDR